MLGECEVKTGRERIERLGFIFSGMGDTFF